MSWSYTKVRGNKKCGQKVAGFAAPGMRILCGLYSVRMHSSTDVLPGESGGGRGGCTYVAAACLRCRRGASSCRPTRASHFPCRVLVLLFLGRRFVTAGEFVNRPDSFRVPPARNESGTKRRPEHSCRAHRSKRARTPGQTLDTPAAAAKREDREGRSGPCGGAPGR